MTAVPRFVLASQSPARRTVLHNAGIDATVVVSGVDESDASGSAAEVALALAIRKATAVAANYPDDALVLGCDSVLELDGEALGKPADAAEARARWRRMRGEHGILHTGHCLVDSSSGRNVARIASTRVWFADVDDAEIAAYVGSGEPLAVAGAFTIDGLGGPFVERVDGDPHNVVGLSLPVLRLMVRELGYRWTDLWSTGP